MEPKVIRYFLDQVTFSKLNIVYRTNKIQKPIIEYFSNFTIENAIEEIMIEKVVMTALFSSSEEKELFGKVGRSSVEHLEEFYLYLKLCLLSLL